MGNDGNSDNRRPVHRPFIDRREPQQVFALDRSAPVGAPLFYLEDDQAFALRARAQNGELVCPVDGCPDRRFTTVHRRRGRDHFRHLPGSNAAHGPESLAHLTAKNLVARWLRTRHPEARVTEEGRTDAGRTADVLAEFPDGRRFAFEVQYAALSPDEWQQRHDDYASSGITDVWLFGHPGRHLVLHRWGGEVQRLARLLDLHREVLATRVPLLWIDPFLPLGAGSVATAVQPFEERRAGRPYEWRSEHPFDVCALAECRIEGDAFLTPTLRKQRAEDEAAARRRAAAQKAYEEALRRQERLEKEGLSREEWMERVRARQEAEADEYLAVKFPDGDVPWFISSSTWNEFGIFMRGDHWRAKVFFDWVQGRIGQTTTFKRIAAPVAARQTKHGQRVFNPLAHYLRLLRAEGYVEFDEPDGLIATITAVADLDHPPAPKPQEPPAPGNPAGYGGAGGLDSGRSERERLERERVERHERDEASRHARQRPVGSGTQCVLCGGPLGEARSQHVCRRRRAEQQTIRWPV